MVRFNHLKSRFLKTSMYSQVFAIFATSDGKSIRINKYFLFLYNEFYRQLLHSHMNEELVFIFEGIKEEDLITLSKDIENRHLNCQFKDTKKPDDTTEPDFTEEESESQSTSSTEEVIENETDFPLVGNTILKCPFPCQDVDTSWSPDDLYAHLYLKHPKEVESNYFVTIDTFIDKLEKEISRKCIYNCSASSSYKVYRLKEHYQRAHLEDPMDCQKCGKTFKNKFNLRHHMVNIEKSRCIVVRFVVKSQKIKETTRPM